MATILELVSLVMATATPFIFLAVWRAALITGTPAPVTTALRRAATLGGQLGIVLILLGFVADGFWIRVREREWAWVVLLAALWGVAILALWGSTRPALRRRIAERRTPSPRHYWLIGMQNRRVDPLRPQTTPTTED